MGFLTTLKTVFGGSRTDVFQLEGRWMENALSPNLVLGTVWLLLSADRNDAVMVCSGLACTPLCQFFFCQSCVLRCYIYYYYYSVKKCVVCCKPFKDTTRLSGVGEIHGGDYYFVSKQAFESDVAEGRFVEYGEYEKHLFGTSMDSIREVVHSGRVCVLNLHPQVCTVLVCV